MHSKLQLLFSVCLSALVCSQPHLGAKRDPSSQLMYDIIDEYLETTSSALPVGSCASDNIAVRREWDNLSKAERQDYLQAVQCLQAKKPISNTTLAHTRYEEFVLSHINMTLQIHFSGLLLPWHRYFVWLYEKALRDECRYQGYQPYWDWSKYLENPQDSSVFDGSAYSLGGNGKAISHGPTNITMAGGAPPAISYLSAPGSGGGCVVGGPFSNYTLLLDAKNEGASTPIQIFDTTRCLVRDFVESTLKEKNSYQNVTGLIVNSEDIHAFRAGLEADNGVHRGGHEFVGGENNNLFTSPSDPIFYLHHGMIDRVWAIWQSRDIENRTLALDGTKTWWNYPPSANVTLGDDLNMGSLGSVKVQDIMSTLDGRLCYRYE
ncbi:putative tyrosinase [Ilyonectria destructans]|nr:putative tyrosinase [Ilyonectria destructans]